MPNPDRYVVCYPKSTQKLYSKCYGPYMKPLNSKPTGLLGDGLEVSLHALCFRAVRALRL